MYLYAGTFDANDFNVTLSGGSKLSTTTANSGASLIMGNGTWTISGTGTGITSPWATGAGVFTITPENSTIILTGTGAATEFDGGGKTYNNLQFTGTQPLITDSNTFNSITLQSDSAQTLTLTSTTTQTFTGEGIRARSATGGAGGGKKTVQSSAAALATLSKTGGYLTVDLAGGTASWIGKAGTSLGVFVNWGSISNCSTTWNRFLPGQ